ncbi:hypothetical protein M422DRAFT_241089 [Sphaerobolus stellatus SS14]|nr:hypothetical protein M422DRAFT_241089 [Sphaerobolus stellatus SS14]
MTQNKVTGEGEGIPIPAVASTSLISATNHDSTAQTVINFNPINQSQPTCGSGYFVDLPSDLFGISHICNASTNNTLYSAVVLPSMLTPLPPGGEASLDLDTPFREQYRAYPILHFPTWDRQKAHPLLINALVMRGASYFSRNSKALSRIGDEYVLKVLRSGLRDRIFRMFMKSEKEELNLQFQLLLAMMLIQLGASLHQDPLERSVADGYHCLAATMLRNSGIPSHVEMWRSSLTLSNASSNHELWLQWTNLIRPSLLFTTEDYKFFLPVDESLWSSSNADDWLSLFLSKGHAGILGSPLSWAVKALIGPNLKPGTIPMNHFSCFIIVHALVRLIFECVDEAMHD